MKKVFFILIGLIFLNSAFAQKANQPFGYAFSMLIQPGTIAVDENGIPMAVKINKERFIYIMVPRKDMPIIKTISYNKIGVKWDMPAEVQKEYAPVSESTQKTMSIKPFKGWTMWRINIQEFDNHSIQSKAVPIVIKGSIGTKPFTMAIYKETSVQGYDSY